MTSARHSLTLPVDKKELFPSRSRAREPGPAVDRPGSSAAAALLAAGEGAGPSPLPAPYFAEGAPSQTNTPMPRYDPTPSPLQRMPRYEEQSMGDGGLLGGVLAEPFRFPLPGRLSSKQVGEESSSSLASAAAAAVTEELLWSVCAPLVKQAVAALQVALHSAVQAKLAGGSQGPAAPHRSPGSERVPATASEAPAFPGLRPVQPDVARSRTEPSRFHMSPRKERPQERAFVQAAADLPEGRPPSSQSSPGGDPFGAVLGTGREPGDAPVSSVHASVNNAANPEISPAVPARPPRGPSWADVEDTPRPVPLGTASASSAAVGGEASVGLMSSGSAAVIAEAPVLSGTSSASATAAAAATAIEEAQPDAASSNVRRNSHSSETKSRAMVCHHWRSKGWCKLEERCKFMHPEHKRGVAGAKGDRSRGPVKGELGRHVGLAALQMGSESGTFIDPSSPDTGRSGVQAEASEGVASEARGRKTTPR